MSPNNFQLAGASANKATRYVPLYTSSWFSGLYTNRSPLRGTQSHAIEKYYPTFDALIDGSNIEISNRLTPIRRPGNSVYNSQSFTDVLSFYDFHEFSTTSEQIRVIVDTAAALYDGTGPSTKSLIFTKSAGSGQSFMLGVGNNLFFGDGVDQKKWVQSLFTRTSSTNGLPNIGNSVTLTDAGTPFIQTYLIDSNGNLQELIATSKTTVTNVTYVQSTNLLTLTVGSTAGIAAGSLWIIWDAATATWLNGITFEVVTAGGTTVTANLLNATHADYASAGETAHLAFATGGTPVTGGSVPTWNTTVPVSGNNFQGGITIDGTAIWLNRGLPIENWGIVNGADAPSVVVGTSGSAWKANTFYSFAGVVIDSNGNLQQVTTPGLGGAVEPTWAVVVGNTTPDGDAVWTMIQTAASLTWASGFAYTAGFFLVNSASGTDCLFQLAPITTPYINGTINVRGWNSTSNGAFNKSFPAPAGDFTFTAASLSWHGNTGQNTQIDTINGAGTVTGQTDTGHYENWEAAIYGTIHIRVAGQYSFNLSHDDGALIGFGGTAQKISGTVINAIGTQTAVNGYPLMAGNNNSGSYPFDPLVVNFPTAGDYPFEIDWTNWEHASRMLLTCNGQTIVPTATPISGTVEPVWPAWTTSFAPNYPSVKESANQFQWNNLGPAVDATWQANITFTLPNTTITDPVNNTEAPYRAGVSGTNQPTFQTGFNQLTLDNPNLTWINKGPASAPAPGTISAFDGGFQYAVSLVNDATDTVSNASLISTATGNFIGAEGITITGGLPALADIDPQSNFVAIFRTVDGGATPFLIPGTSNSLYTVPLADYLVNGYVDTTPDNGLNLLLQAPVNGENTPPAMGAINLAFHLNRIFFSIGNVVYWTAGPDSPIGNGFEGVPPLNNANFPSFVKRLVPTSVGIFVYTVSDIYLIIGNGTPQSPLFAVPYLPGKGISTYNAVAINGSLTYIFSTAASVMTIDPNGGYYDLGFPIGDQFKASNWNAANVYLTWYEYGEDVALFVADGTTGWFRGNPTPSPESGQTWSPFATIIGGVQALNAIEVTPGVKKLLLGSPTTGPILARDLTTNADNSSPYFAFFTIGSLVLAQPGQMAQVAFISADSIATGTRPSVSVLLDEISGVFDPIDEWVDDPPKLAPSLTTYAQRWYLIAGDQPALCRHMQIKFSYPDENQPNELLTMTIFGGFIQSK